MTMVAMFQWSLPIEVWIGLFVLFALGAVTITRTAMTDDDGTGTTGTVINNAWKTELYNQIDAALAALPQGIAHSGTRVIQIAFAAAQNASTDANTLDDYEEGTFTPTDASGAGLAFTTALGIYIKIGQLVAIAVRVNYPVTPNGAAASIGSVPFTTNSSNPNFGGAISFTDYGTPITSFLATGGTAVTLFNYSGTAITNANLSGKDVRFTAIYRAAS